MVFLFVKIMKLFQPQAPPQEIVKTPIEIYEESYMPKFLKSFEQPEQTVYNSNIDPILYTRKELLEQLKDSENIYEKTWRNNILYESSPRGNIVMYYDVFKQGFAYYSDQSITYNILNVAAMKYCMHFSCRDFFQDESILTQPSAFTKLMLEEEKEESDKKKQSVKERIPTITNARFAKLKNYAIDNNNDKTQKLKDSTTSNDQKKEPEKIFIMNKFIYLGKTNNFDFIQKTAKPSSLIPILPASNKPTMFDEMFTDVKTVNKEVFNYKMFKEQQMKRKLEMGNELGTD